MFTKFYSLQKTLHVSFWFSWDVVNICCLKILTLKTLISELLNHIYIINYKIWSILLQISRVGLIWPLQIRIVGLKTILEDLREFVWWPATFVPNLFWNLGITVIFIFSPYILHVMLYIIWYDTSKHLWEFWKKINQASYSLIIWQSAGELQWPQAIATFEWLGVHACDSNVESKMLKKRCTFKRNRNWFN